MFEEFKALVAKYPHLAADIDNIRESEQSNVLYEYNGIMTCAVVNSGAAFGDVCDVFPRNEEIQRRANCDKRTRWFNTLEELVSTLAEETDPENIL